VTALVDLRSKRYRFAARRDVSLALDMTWLRRVIGWFVQGVGIRM